MAGRIARNRDDDGYYTRDRYDRREYDTGRRPLRTNGGGGYNGYSGYGGGSGYNNNRSSNNNRESHKGHCIWFNKKRGYGFVKDEVGGDYFVHATSILDAPFLIPGAQVRFNIARAGKGWFARNVELRNEIECYKCGGKAHFARDCVTR